MDDLKDKRVLQSGDTSAPHLVIGPLQAKNAAGGAADDDDEDDD
jgi:hypothetical protein